MATRGNIFSRIPEDLAEELFEPLLRSPGLSVERIISKGQTSPGEGWYDQAEHEWVIVLQGTAEIAFEAAPSVKLVAGDYLDIPAHTRHKVVYTSSDPETIWLALRYGPAP